MFNDLADRAVLHLRPPVVVAERLLEALVRG
jgi:hypothetical protein